MWTWMIMHWCSDTIRDYSLLTFLVDFRATPVQLLLHFNPPFALHSFPPIHSNYGIQYVSHQTDITSFVVEHGRGQEIKNAPSILKATIWRHFGFYEDTDKHNLDETHEACKVCHTRSKYLGLYGAVLVVKSDSSRKEGPAIHLLHTLRVVSVCCWKSCPLKISLSSLLSAAEILLIQQTTP